MVLSRSWFGTISYNPEWRHYVHWRNHNYWTSMYILYSYKSQVPKLHFYVRLFHSYSHSLQPTVLMCMPVCEPDIPVCEPDMPVCEPDMPACEAQSWWVLYFKPCTVYQSCVRTGLYMYMRWCVSTCLYLYAFVYVYWHIIPHWFHIIHPMQVLSLETVVWKYL